MEALEPRRLLYAVGPSVWPTTELTYAIVEDGTYWPTARGSGPSNLYEHFGALSDNWEAEVDAAFSEWASHSALTFTRVDSDADITIGGIDEGTADAWAYYPGGGGNITLRTGSAILGSHYSDHRLWQTLVHEIGHSLGLAHSPVLGSVMGIHGGFHELHPDDVAGIQELYGKPEDASDPIGSDVSELGFVVLADNTLDHSTKKVVDHSHEGESDGHHGADASVDDSDADSLVRGEERVTLRLLFMASTWRG